jgi:hypothetical protein
MILKLTKSYLKNKEKSKLSSQGVNISSQAPIKFMEKSNE